MIPPTIRLKNCIMRPFAIEDAKPLFELLGDHEVIQFMPWKETPSFERVEKFVEEQIRHWNNYPYGWWALEKSPGNELMGWCGLQHLPETGETEIGYLLGKRFWGNGIASASADVSLRYGFITVGLEKIIALVHPENHSSIEVIKKLTMKLCDHIHLWGMDLDRYCITSRKYFEIMENPR